MREGALQALRTYREEENVSGQLHALHSIAFAEGLLGNLDTELALLEVEAALADPQSLEFARTHDEIGSVYLMNDDIEQAERHLRLSRDILQTFPESERTFLSWWHYMTSTKLTIKKFDQTGEQRLLEEVDSNLAQMQQFTNQNSPAEVAHLHMASGLVRGVKGSIEDAEIDFEEGKNLFEQENQPFGVAEINYFHAFVLLKAGKIEEGLPYLDQAEEIITRLGAKNWLQSINTLRERYQPQ